MMNNTINQVNFKGKLILGHDLSKEFQETVPELEKVIKNKPYDVEANTYISSFRSGGKKFDYNTTILRADNWGYIKKPLERWSNHVITSKITTKNTAQEYQETMEALAEKMDARIPKKVPFNERVKNFINSLFNKNAEKKG